LSCGYLARRFRRRGRRAGSEASDVLIVEIAAAIHQVSDGGADAEWRNDQDDDAVAEGLDSAGSSGSGALVADGATLGTGGGRGSQGYGGKCAEQEQRT
jgi:hypothetical protein